MRQQPGSFRVAQNLNLDAVERKLTVPLRSRSAHLGGVGHPLRPRFGDAGPMKVEWSLRTLVPAIVVSASLAEIVNH
jgi:hypothetical protein